MACKSCTGSSGGSTNVNNICVSCGGGSGSGSGTGGTDPGAVDGGLWQPPTGSSPGGGNGKNPPTPTNPPDPSSGSGPDGQVQNGDVRRALGGCLEVFSYGFCAPTINLNVSLKTAIEGILTSNGGLQAGEKLISCRLNAYGRATITAVKIGVPDVIGIDLGDLTQDKIFISDADGTDHEVKSTHETTTIDVPFIGQFKFDGLFYNGTGIDIPMSSGGEVTLHGRLQRFDLPLFNDSSANTPNCDPDDSNQSAGFRVCVTDYVVRPTNADKSGFGYNFDFNVGNQTGYVPDPITEAPVAYTALWDVAGPSKRAVFTELTSLAPDDTHPADRYALLDGGLSNKSIFIVPTADKAYHTLTGTFKYATGDLTGKVVFTLKDLTDTTHSWGSGDVAIHQTSLDPTPGEHLIEANYSVSMPEGLIVGHYYGLTVRYDGITGITLNRIGIDDVVGTFGGAS